MVSPGSGHRTCASDSLTCCRQMRLMVCMNILGVITKSRSASSAVMSWLPSTCCANISCNARQTAHVEFLYHRPDNARLLSRHGPSACKSAVQQCGTEWTIKQCSSHPVESAPVEGLAGLQGSLNLCSLLLAVGKSSASHIRTHMPQRAKGW